MQNRPMANNIYQCDFLFQLLLHTLHLVIPAFLSHEVLLGKNFKLRFLQNTWPKNFDFRICCRKLPKVLDFGSPNFSTFHFSQRLFPGNVRAGEDGEARKTYVPFSCLLFKKSGERKRNERNKDYYLKRSAMLALKN